MVKVALALDFQDDVHFVGVDFPERCYAIILAVKELGTKRTACRSIIFLVAQIHYAAH